MRYPMRALIIDPSGEPFHDTGMLMVAPLVSRPHIGKRGLAEKVGDNVRITLDDGTVLWGYECWWTPEREPDD